MTNLKNHLLAWCGVMLLIFGQLTAQTSFDYEIEIEPMTIDGMDGLHSYAFGEVDGKWIFIGGRRDGIHARQPFNAFPASENNTTIYVVDPESEVVLTANISGLSTAIREQLQSTNMQFFQDGDILYFLGGYGYSASVGDHISYPNLTSINLPGLVSDILLQGDISDNFTQITDENFAVTGGYLGKIGDEFLLVGGHRFDGRYNPMEHPTYVQAYTNQIRKFKLSNENGLIVSDYSTVTDEVNLRRRDYNLVPQIFPDGVFGYTIFSGVFQLNLNMPFLYPVDVRADGHIPNFDFSQRLCNYHAANISLFDSLNNTMHNLFFGGISQYYFSDGNLMEDLDIPFVKTISRVSRAADGTLEEVAFEETMPAFVGTGAEFIQNENLPKLENVIVRMDNLSGDRILLGHIFGGIESPVQHAFSYNNSDVTFASNTIFKVFLNPKEVTGVNDGEQLNGYHDFDINISPNPMQNNFFNVQIQTPESGRIDIMVTNLEGKILINEVIDGVEKGMSNMELEMPVTEPGLYFLTLTLNGKYFSSKKIIIQRKD